MGYTQLKLKTEYRDKLKSLALSEGRSMANMAERLIDTAIDLKWPKQAPEKPKDKLPKL